MIVRVAMQVSQSSASECIVATDHKEVADAVERAGFRAVITNNDLPSGSDRVEAAARICQFSEDDIVVNVQGDEPMIPPEVIDQVAALSGDPDRHVVGTLCEPICSGEELVNPDVVKVACTEEGRALYFSRAPLPWDREAFNPSIPPELGEHWRRHIGIYAFPRGALRQFVQWKPTRLERLESLEQLRLLEHGIDIAVAYATRSVPAGVDTPADAERIRNLIRSM